MVPATVDWPEYARYPVGYVGLDETGFPTSQGSTAAEALAAAGLMGVPVTVRAEHICPFNTPVVTISYEKWLPRSTCGSMRWVVDTDRSIQKREMFLAALSGTPTFDIQDGALTERWAQVTQSWWLTRARDMIASRGLDGFYVECLATAGHTGLCTVQDWTWDRHSGAVIA